MNSELWGPPMWHTLHTLSLDYSHVPTTEQQQTMSVFLDAIGKLLPCISCREHYQRYVQEYPLAQAVQSAEDLQRWILELHNRVNERLGKSKYTFDQWYNEITTRYGWLSSSPGKRMSTTVILCIVIGILLIGITLYFGIKGDAIKVRPDV